jgi:hypothetical protein
VADLDAVARELVEAGMPWLPGMRLAGLTYEGDRLLRFEEERVTWIVEDGRWFSLRSQIPDLTDWPTIGALLGELSGRGRPLLCQHPDGVWACDLIGHGVPRSARAVKADTPGEAVGRALLAVLRAERGTS